MGTSTLDIDDRATEEIDSTPVTSARNDQVKEQPRSFFKNARRELDEKEWSSPAARRFLIAEIERLDSETSELKKFREMYFEANTSLEVLRESNKKNTSNEILSYMCLSIGSVGIGAAPSYIPISDVGWIFTIGSAILIIGGILARIRR